MPTKAKAIWSIGIDPGWKNAGIALLCQDENGLRLVCSHTLSPFALGGVVEGVDEVIKIISKHVHPSDVASIGIERYVSYNNVNTAETENILMFIGALRYGLATFLGSANCELYRAIEWKMALVKLLVKNKSFDNPSTALDKKFSIAAAHACLDIKGEFSNDHEADAVCLGAIGLLKARYATKPKAS
jgi:Holliday junction resolvasome RuvABC endonuclease subunit